MDMTCVLDALLANYLAMFTLQDQSTNVGKAGYA